MSDVRIGTRPAVWTASGADAFDVQIGLTKQAEELGLEAVFFGDRMLASVGDESGRGVYESTHTELFVTLSALSARTSRIRLGSLVMVVPFRHPVQLAKLVASLDLLSRGRLILGVGAGWNPSEFEAMGIPREEAAARMVEGIECMRALWSGERVDYDGEHVRFRDVAIEPRPHRAGGPPVWLGSFSPIGRRIWERNEISPGVERVLARVGAHADGWAPLLYSTRVRRCIDPELLGRAWELVQLHAASAGRPPVEFVFSHWYYAIENAEDEAAARRDLGFFFPGTFEEARETYLIGSPEEIAEKVRGLSSRLDRVDWVVLTMLGPSERQLELLHSRVVPLLRTAV
ncbi:MAG: LLM class flavin-dependent oxidoreductase [Solirubrobacteraceae bacterium]